MPVYVPVPSVCLALLSCGVIGVVSTVNEDSLSNSLLGPHPAKDDQLCIRECTRFPSQLSVLASQSSCIMCLSGLDVCWPLVAVSPSNLAMQNLALDVRY